jgi:hypothetical protein
MNDKTLVAVCCYDGDAHQVVRALPQYFHHDGPIIILSPEDSKVTIPGIICRHAGKRAYVGADSLHRQLLYFRTLLGYNYNYFLLNDSDSFCVSAKIPERLYAEADNGVVWSNEVTEPRPHLSPYPKIAMQPPYFFTRASMEKMMKVGQNIPVHPITPYVDWFMVAMMSEAGLTHRAFTELEHSSSYVFKATETDPNRACWQQLDYRIRYCGTCFCHPIKTPEQVSLCVEARRFYESSKS